MLQLCLENILDIFVSQQIFKKICIDITEKNIYKVIEAIFKQNNIANRR